MHGSPFFEFEESRVCVSAPTEDEPVGRYELLIFAITKSNLTGGTITSQSRIFLKETEYRSPN
jgi:hypothetical protein